jgi:hypothetical protein
MAVTSPDAAKKASKADHTRAAKKRKAQTAHETGAKKPSALQAAALVLSETGHPMTCKEMIDAMATKGYWASPNGQTPHATLYAGILKEINAKGADARFKKTERGKFALSEACT